jgi:hypothetical protein
MKSYICKRLFGKAETLCAKAVQHQAENKRMKFKDRVMLKLVVKIILMTNLYF